MDILPALLEPFAEAFFFEVAIAFFETNLTVGFAIGANFLVFL